MKEFYKTNYLLQYVDLLVDMVSSDEIKGNGF